MRDPPSGRVPEQGPDWVLVATEACGGGTLDLFCSAVFLGYMEIYIGERSTSGGHEGPTRVDGAPRGWARPLPHGLLEASLTTAPHLLDHVRSKNHAPEGFIPFGLRLIFLFCETLKQGKKQKLAMGTGSIC